MKNPWKLGLVIACGASAALMAVAVTTGEAQQDDGYLAGGGHPGGVALAQSGTRQSSPRSSGTKQAPSAPFEERLWRFLRDSRYENWAPIPGTNGDFSEGHSPHGDFVKVYVNRTAAGDPTNLPNGSILVKENYGEDKKSLMAITVMYRTKGYDPAHNDWFWVKYEADGRVAEMNRMKTAGKLTMCIDCHSQAGGDDFVYGNDGN